LPKSSVLNAFFVAADGGPQETLRPLAKYCGSTLVEVQDERAEHDEFWGELFTEANPDLLLVGTSDTARGRRIESAARRAAVHGGVPVAAIEDFPGNYYDLPDAPAGLVAVESEFCRALNARKFGARCPQIVVVPPARYDPYRARHAELRRATAARWKQGAGTSEFVLWAGQPETSDAVCTLKALMPALAAEKASVLFKAHPRDAGYRDGVYPKLFDDAGVPFRDVTLQSVEDALALAPRLVLTQFSSVAVEAGFYGVPSLHVLLANAGGTRLHQKKGYSVPPLCLAGGAAHATEETMLATMLHNALRDENLRARLIGCFDDYFGTGEPTTPRLVKYLGAFASGTRLTP